MKEEFTFYVGVDWGVEFHQACISSIWQTLKQSRVARKSWVFGSLEFRAGRQCNGLG
jgi:hypothetical protein